MAFLRWLIFAEKMAMKKRGNEIFGVGNENWGCGGNMRPEYYADLYRRYQTYVRQYGDKKSTKSLAERMSQTIIGQKR